MGQVVFARAHTALLLAAVALIPWQATYIMHAPTIGNPPDVWQYGVVGVYPFDILIGCAAMVWGARRISSLRKRPLRFSRTGVFVFFALAFAIGAMAFLLSTAPEPLSGAAHLVRLAEAALLVSLLYSTGISWRAIAYALAAGGIAVSLFSFGQFFAQETGPHPWLGVARHAASQLGDAVVEYGDERWLRAYGTFGHPNIFAGYLGGILIVLIALFREARSKREELFCIGAAQIVIAALFITFSRSAWIATLAALAIACVVVLMKKRSGRQLSEVRRNVFPSWVVFALASAVILGSLGAAYRDLVAVRLGLHGPARLEVRSLAERTAGLKEGIALVRQHWLTGVGVAQSTAVQAGGDEAAGRLKPAYAYQPAHNAYLVLFIELGIGGFLILLALLVWRVRRLAGASWPFAQTTLFVFALTVGVFDHFVWTLPVGMLVWALFLFFPTETKKAKLALEVAS